MRFGSLILQFRSYTGGLVERFYSTKLGGLRVLGPLFCNMWQIIKKGKSCVSFAFMFAIFSYSILSFLSVTTQVKMTRPTPFYDPFNLLTVPFV